MGRMNDERLVRAQHSRPDRLNTRIALRLPKEYGMFVCR